MSQACAATLIRHPATPADAVSSVAVEVRRSADMLAFRFALAGDLRRIVVPGAGALRPEHQLWLHTCCEAFLCVDGETAYSELNFAPSRAWMAYAFRAYRDGVPLEDPALVRAIEARVGSENLVLEAEIALARLPLTHSHAPLRVGATAVVEGVDGTLSYWALHHPEGVPDFHCSGAWTLRLEGSA